MIDTAIYYVAWVILGPVASSVAACLLIVLIVTRANNKKTERDNARGQVPAEW